MPKLSFRELLTRFSWPQVRAELGWSESDPVNIASACVGRYATSARTALRWQPRHGNPRDVSFAELEQESNRFANFLVARGIGRGERVAVYMPRRPETVAMILGILKAGAIYVPIFSGFSGDAIRYRVVRSGARLLCTTGALRPTVPADLQVQALVVDPDAAGARAGDLDYAEEINAVGTVFVSADRRREDPAAIIYTSGSTGNPKGGVLATNLLASVCWPYCRYALDLRPNDRFWPTGDPGWGYGFVCYLGALALGNCVFFAEGNLGVEYFLDVLGAEAISNIATTPTLLRGFMALGADAIAQRQLNLRVISSCGEPLNPEVVQFFRRVLGITPMDQFGATEYGLPICNLNAAEMEVRPGSMGLPVPGLRMAVVDDRGAELGPGSIGYIGKKPDADSRYFLGYWEDEAATQNVFRNGWIVTGDLGRRDTDGYFWFEGRNDDIITSAGYRIGPFEIESAILQHPAVAEAAVVGKPDTLRGQIVKAFVVLKTGYRGDAALSDEIVKLVKTSLGRHQYPREVAYVESLPKTQTGKIQRFKLRELA